VLNNNELTPLGRELDSISSGKLSSKTKFFLKPENKSKPDAPNRKKIGTSLVLVDEFENLSRVGLVNLSSGKVDKALSITPVAQQVYDKEVSRIAAATGVKALSDPAIKSIEVDSFLNPFAAGEGAELARFRVPRWGKGAQDQDPLVEIVPSRLIIKDRDQLQQWSEGVTYGKAQNLARQLANTPSNLMTPSIFCDTVRQVFSDANLLKTPDNLHGTVEMIVRDRDWAKSKGMGCFLGVSQGSAEPPRFLELHYRGGPPDEAPLVLVGKGVTFDTGGISIKPAQSMALMKGDMTGAAVVVSTLFGLASLRGGVNVTVLTPLCENMPSGTAVKPGDILTAMNGKTAEVDNTDAEGRLILADALAYSHTFKPSAVIDVATLTGAMGVALGNASIGAFCTKTSLFRKISTAGLHAGERFWRMPLWNSYKNQIKSDVADILNIGRPSGGGSCTAAMFLKEFVEVDNWIHLDIAGVMESTGSDKPYIPKGMTGAGVRALIEFARNPNNEGLLDANDDVVDFEL